VKQFTKHNTSKSLRRIFLYHGLLVRLNSMGVRRVYSYTLAEGAGVTPEQVRKDFLRVRYQGKQEGRLYDCIASE